jgi:hypothetical protein
MPEFHLIRPWLALPGLAMAAAVFGATTAFRPIEYKYCKKAVLDVSVGLSYDPCLPPALPRWRNNGENAT